MAKLPGWRRTFESFWATDHPPGYVFGIVSSLADRARQLLRSARPLDASGFASEDAVRVLAEDVLDLRNLDQTQRSGSPCALTMILGANRRGSEFARAQPRKRPKPTGASLAAKVDGH